MPGYACPGFGEADALDVPTEHVSYRIDTHLQPRVLHRLEKPVADLLVHIRECQPVESAVVCAANFRLCLHRLDKPLPVYVDSHVRSFAFWIKIVPNTAGLGVGEHTTEHVVNSSPFGYCFPGEPPVDDGLVLCNQDTQTRRRDKTATGANIVGDTREFTDLIHHSDT
jgi:hypothetical protein